jgi:hypothetical protein
MNAVIESIRNKGIHEAAMEPGFRARFKALYFELEAGFLETGDLDEPIVHLLTNPSDYPDQKLHKFVLDLTGIMIDRDTTIGKIVECMARLVNYKVLSLNPMAELVLGLRDAFPKPKPDGPMLALEFYSVLYLGVRPWDINPGNEEERFSYTSNFILNESEQQIMRFFSALGFHYYRNAPKKTLIDQLYVDLIACLDTAKQATLEEIAFRRRLAILNYTKRISLMDFGDEDIRKHIMIPELKRLHENAKAAFKRGEPILFPDDDVEEEEDEEVEEEEVEDELAVASPHSISSDSEDLEPLDVDKALIEEFFKDQFGMEVFKLRLVLRKINFNAIPNDYMGELRDEIYEELLSALKRERISPFVLALANRLALTNFTLPLTDEQKEILKKTIKEHDTAAVQSAEMRAVMAGEAEYVVPPPNPASPREASPREASPREASPRAASPRAASPGFKMYSPDGAASPGFKMYSPDDALPESPESPRTPVKPAKPQVALKPVVRPGAGKPADAKPIVVKPVVVKPVVAKPVVGKPVVAKPVVAKPGAKPAVVAPGAAKKKPAIGAPKIKTPAPLAAELAVPVARPRGAVPAAAAPIRIAPIHPGPPPLGYPPAIAGQLHPYDAEIIPVIEETHIAAALAVPPKQPVMYERLYRDNVYNRYENFSTQIAYNIHRKCLLRDFDGQWRDIVYCFMHGTNMKFVIDVFIEYLGVKMPNILTLLTNEEMMTFLWWLNICGTNAETVTQMRKYFLILFMSPSYMLKLLPSTYTGPRDMLSIAWRIMTGMDAFTFSKRCYENLDWMIANIPSWKAYHMYQKLYMEPDSPPSFETPWRYLAGLKEDEISPLEAYFNDIKYPIETLHFMTGDHKLWGSLMLPPEMDKPMIETFNGFVDPYYWYFTENIGHYKEFAKREDDDAPELDLVDLSREQAHAVMQKYTDGELLLAMYLSTDIRPWNSRISLQNYVYDSFNPDESSWFWISENFRCNNDDMDPIEIEERKYGDAENPTIAFGSVASRRCYSLKELISSFREDGEGGYYLMNPVHLPDPGEHQDLKVRFSTPELISLQRLLQSTKYKPAVTLITELLKKIADALKASGHTATYVRERADEYNKMNAAEKKAIVDGVLGYFTSGLYARFWKGPKTAVDYPYIWFEGGQETANTFLDDVVIGIKDRNVIRECSKARVSIDAGGAKVLDFFRKLKIFEYDYEKDEYYMLAYNVSNMTEAVVTGTHCTADYNDRIIPTTYIVLTKIFKYTDRQISDMLRTYFEKPTFPDMKIKDFASSTHDERLANPAMREQLARVE